MYTNGACMKIRYIWLNYRLLRILLVFDFALCFRFRTESYAGLYSYIFPSFFEYWVRYAPVTPLLCSSLVKILAVRERKKGKGVSMKSVVNLPQIYRMHLFILQVVKVLCSIPRTSYVTAINLCCHNKTLKDIINRQGNFIVSFNFIAVYPRFVTECHHFVSLCSFTRLFSANCMVNNKRLVCFENIFPCYG